MTRRAKTMLLLFLPLAGCAQANPLIAKCEAAIQTRMALPSSYRRVSVEPNGAGLRFIYESSNSFGASVRRHGLCLPAGKTVTWRSADPIQMSEGAGSPDKPIEASDPRERP